MHYSWWHNICKCTNAMGALIIDTFGSQFPDKIEKLLQTCGDLPLNMLQQALSYIIHLIASAIVDAVRIWLEYWGGVFKLYSWVILELFLSYSPTFEIMFFKQSWRITGSLILELFSNLKSWLGGFFRLILQLYSWVILESWRISYSWGRAGIIQE